MRMRRGLLIGLFALLPMGGFVQAQSASPQGMLPAGAGRFLFEDRAGPGAPSIEIMSAVGSRCIAIPCKLVIAMHGVNRNAAAMRDAWSKLAEQHDLIVLAPHLDAARFPTRIYQRGGVEGEPDRTKWIYSTIERLYDHLLATKRIKTDGYMLYGHSAGAQFVHRLVLMLPEARFSTAIAANAGFYTLPLGKEAAGGFVFPYSLAGTAVDDAGRKRAFARPLRVLLGEEDRDPDHRQLSRTKGAQAQGPHRLARGQFFFKAAQDEAQRLGAPFAWQLATVPGAAHENRKMVRGAARLVGGL